MHRLQLERLQDQHVQRALEQIGFLFIPAHLVCLNEITPSERQQETIPFSAAGHLTV
jgi:hypothetical protein